MTCADKRDAWIRVYASAIECSAGSYEDERFAQIHDHACRLADDAVASLQARWVHWQAEAAK